jgi:cytosylglucuronate decarboxylase
MLSSGRIAKSIAVGGGGDMRVSGHRYLFIRILEACNADCFMCGYALSQDKYRFSATEFEDLLPKARAAGIAVIRFTGGEPLLHKQVCKMVRAGTDAGMQMSIITNGALLPRMAEALANAGLAQVIVSIDGAEAATHDHFRNMPKLFEKGIEGLFRARELGILTRVNTVVGPHNFEEMPALQGLLTTTAVGQWELSALKLERPIAYGNPDRVRAVCDPIYEADPTALLVPMGKRFYGNTPSEQELFFAHSTAPRASEPQCRTVGDIVYLDAKNGRGFGCSLLPHRDDRQSGGGVPLKVAGSYVFDTPEFRDHVEHFRIYGPKICTGCSSSAAGYSDDVAKAETVAAWSY